MTRFECNALSRALRQRCELRETICIAESYSRLCSVGAAAERAWLKRRRVALLRTRRPFAIAVVAQRERYPWLVYKQENQRHHTPPQRRKSVTYRCHAYPDSSRPCTPDPYSQPCTSGNYHSRCRARQNTHYPPCSYRPRRSMSGARRHRYRTG
jgi:hypothetical protein